VAVDMIPSTLTAPPPAVRSRRAVLIAVARALIVCAVAASIGYAVVSLWSDVRDTFLALDPWAIAGALVAALAAIGANVKAWQAVLRELDHDVSTVAAGRMYLVGQLGKYLPGSVWAFVMQVELSLRAGIPRARSFAASLVLIGMSTTAALLLGLMGLPSLHAVGGAAIWAAVALVPIALVCAVPPVLSRLVDLFLRLLRKGGLNHRLRLRGLAPVVGWSALAWTLFGVQFWLLGAGVGGAATASLPSAIGAFALAMTAGMLAIASPSGLGVREAVLVASLAPFMGAGPALGIALASRLVLTVADVIAAGVAAWSAHRIGVTAERGSAALAS